MSPISYTVRFPAPQSHYAELEARIPLNNQLQLEVFLPVWTPGSYLVREYARNLESFTAVDGVGRPLHATKTRKNRWLIRSAEPLDEVIVSYKLYCNELSVRTNYLDEHFVLLVGAGSFLCIVNELDQRYEVKLELPPSWQGSWSGLSGGQNTFHAPDYDSLIDAPIVAARDATVQPFVVDGKPHLLVNVGDSSLWDIAQAARDVESIVRQHAALWGGELSYDHYLFLNLLTDAPGGGLEHHNSVVMMSDRFAPRTRDTYVGWLDLVSHEHFHVWNVKRLRPVELGPFDYENEVYTRNLWIAEGFTEYYGLLAVRRAGLTTDDEFLGSSRRAGKGNAAGSISGLIEKLQNTPGRLHQPVSLASFDAWIKLYRPDENSVNSSISYYVKGAVIAWLLDARIRAATGDTRSLDDVMRLAYQRFSGSKGFNDEEFRSVVQEVAGQDQNDWFNGVVDTAEELDYSQALAWFGLRFKSIAPSEEADVPPKAWAGFSTKTDGGRLIVTQVPRGTPGSEAGISANDEIVGIDQYRVRPEQWDQRMAQYRPNEEISLLISRHDRLLNIPIRLGHEPAPWLLEPDPAAGPTQKQHFMTWLASSAGMGKQSQD